MIIIYPIRYLISLSQFYFEVIIIDIFSHFYFCHARIQLVFQLKIYTLRLIADSNTLLFDFFDSLGTHVSLI